MATAFPTPSLRSRGCQPFPVRLEKRNQLIFLKLVNGIYFFAYNCVIANRWQLIKSSTTTNMKALFYKKEALAYGSKINGLVIFLLALGLNVSPCLAADDAISVSGPSSVYQGQTYSVTVAYTADASRNVSVYLFNTSTWQIYGSATAVVSAGSGSVTLNVSVGAPPAGTNYQWTGKVETNAREQLDQASAWCQVIFTPVSDNVTISADFSTKTGKKVNRRVFGLNVFKGFNPGITGNTQYLANMAAMNPGHIRYHSWEMVAPDHPNGWVDSDGNWKPSKIADAMDGAFPASSELLINIPWPPSVKGWLDADGKLKTENYQDFANWCAQLVNIVNIDQGRKVKLWELTNERDELYDENNAELGKIWNLCAQACLATDPSIKVGGPAFARPDHLYNVVDFLEATKNKIDFISYHSYPFGNLPSNQEIFDRARTLGEHTEEIRDEWQKISSRPVEFHHNEYNMSWNPPQAKMDNEVMMVFDALTMISFLNAGTDVGAAWNECDGWFGKTDGSYNREPSSWGYENFNNYLEDGDICSSSVDNAAKVVALASLSGTVAQLVLVNRSEATLTVRFNLSGLPPVASSTTVTITEAVQSGGLVEKSTTFGALTGDDGYVVDPFAVTVVSFPLDNASPEPPLPPSNSAYYIYSESGDDFAEEGGSVGSYAMNITDLNAGAPEGSQYRRVEPTNHYASYRFEYGSEGVNKASWASAFLEMQVKTTHDFDLYLEDAAGRWKSRSLSSYFTKSGTWESVRIPFSDFAEIDFSQLKTIGFYRTWNAPIALDFDHVRVTDGSSARTGDISLNHKSSLEGETASAGFRFYPNPVRAGLTVEIAKDIAPARVAVFNTAGQLVYQRSFSEERIYLSREELSTAAGVHIIKVFTSSHCFQEKLIIQ